MSKEENKTSKNEPDVSKSVEETTTSTDLLTTAVKRFEDVSLSLKLIRTYEFTQSKDGGAPKLSSEKPLVNHSWTSKSVWDGRARPIFNEYMLGDRDSIVLPLGVTALFGRSGQGKTFLAYERLFKTMDRKESGRVKYMKLFEPGPDHEIAKVSKNISIPRLEVEAASEIATALLMKGGPDLLILDSLRYLFYSSSGGATGRGGVNMGLFMDLTHLDTVAMALGKSILAVINPMTDDDTAFSFYQEAAKGAVASLVTMNDVNSYSQTTRYGVSRDANNIKMKNAGALVTSDATLATNRRPGTSPFRDR